MCIIGLLLVNYWSTTGLLDDHDGSEASTVDGLTNDTRGGNAMCGGTRELQCGHRGRGERQQRELLLA